MMAREEKSIYTDQDRSHYRNILKSIHTDKWENCKNKSEITKANNSAVIFVNKLKKILEGEEDAIVDEVFEMYLRGGEMKYLNFS